LRFQVYLPPFYRKCWPVIDGVTRLVELQKDHDVLRVKENQFMRRTMNQPIISMARASVCLLLILLGSVSCGLKKSGRSFEQQTFDSQKWRDGDDITRGTMIFDLHRKRTLSGQLKEGVVALLGEPNKKRSNNRSEVWLYQIETVGEKPLQFFPVSFDRNGRASSGEAKDGTLSLAVDE
jgi:hypothetical protein